MARIQKSVTKKELESSQKKSSAEIAQAVANAAKQNEMRAESQPSKITHNLMK